MKSLVLTLVCLLCLTSVSEGARVRLRERTVNSRKVVRKVIQAPRLRVRGVCLGGSCSR